MAEISTQRGVVPARVTRAPSATSPVEPSVEYAALEMNKTREMAQQILRQTQPYLVHPQPGITAVNNPSPFPLIVENGMNMSSESITAMGQGIANRFGRPALVVPNHTEGFQRDVRNCVLAAFSSRAGFQAEQGAAGHLAKALVARLHDPYPVEITGYSQGTLITQNVLTELRGQLLQQGQEKLWQSFAERIELRTYGAALHRWPAGVKVTECRHAGDFVAVVGDAVSLCHATNGVLRGDFTSRRAEVTVLPVFSDAHSIQRYLENGSRFYAQTTAALPPAEKAGALLASMSRSEFSNAEYDRILTELCAPSAGHGARSRDANKAILFAREMVLALPQNPAALHVIGGDAVGILIEASQQPLRKEPKNVSSFDGRGYHTRPGSGSRSSHHKGS